MFRPPFLGTSPCGSSSSRGLLGRPGCCRMLFSSRVKDLNYCLPKASSSFGGLSKRVWQSHSLRLSTKIQVYGAVVIPILLYGAETWILYRKQIRLLDRFHQRCLRSILGTKWQNCMSNEKVLTPSIESILLQVQLRWAGHVLMMNATRMPKAIFFSELQEGKSDPYNSKKALQRPAEKVS